jgi:LDH2 family malate/lactate/ureidoglycolate dehydrogenase
MTEKDYYVPFDLLERFMSDVFIKLGVPGEDARTAAEILITSDKRGISSHGIARMKDFYYDRIKNGTLNPVTECEVIRDGFTTAVIDGHDGLGHVIAKKAMEIAILKARKYGMGMTAVRNSNHYGIAGYYVLQAVKEGMMGMTGTNARPAVAPTFGVQNMFGTNPLTFGFPTDEEFPFVYDGATSLVQRGKIEIYKRLNKKLPEGWVIDRRGLPMTDPDTVLEQLIKGGAALTPLGGIGEENSGYKGYGLAMVVEILSSAFQSGSFLQALSGFDSKGKKTYCHIGHFFLAVDISCFTELDIFKKNAGEMLRQVRASQKAPGHDRIYTAGEKEHLFWIQNRDRGAPITNTTMKEMILMRDELGLFGYDF